MLINFPRIVRRLYTVLTVATDTVRTVSDALRPLVIAEEKRMPRYIIKVPLS